MAVAARSERLAALAAVGTSIWLDMIRRSMIESGELERLMTEDSVSGVTANPTIFEKAILGSPDYDERLRELAEQGADADSIYETLALEDVGAAADVLRPAWEASGGADGFVSIEVDPALAHDAAGTVSAAEDFWARLARPNVMIKIPGTEEGAEAIRAATARGINVNVTLLFAVEAYARVAEAYMLGLEDRLGRGEPIDSIASVASFFVSRVDTLVDRRLREDGHEELAGTAGVANARLAYARYREIVSSGRWAELEERGAARQQPLWASTGVKDPAYRDVKYVEELAGPETVNTMPLETLLAFGDHGEARDGLSGTADEASGRLRALAEAGISIDEVTAQLLVEGIEKFEASMRSLRAGIERKRDAILSDSPIGVQVSLPDEDAKAIRARVEWADSEEVARRVWSKDHTLWGPHADEISDRLGWLRITEEMLEHLDELEAFAQDVRAEGLSDCVVLGMGGSSLAPEVLRRSFADAAGLQLFVLDSTHPDAVAALSEALPLERTLFIVASKSGTTLEPDCLYRHFRSRVEEPSQFAAITDPGTPLQALAEKERFRRTFCANPEIGGRYSALSHFGMVPATTAGIDSRQILERAEVAVHATVPSLPCEASPPLWLGLALGELARRGRDKLTFVVDPPLSSFGLWAEQLVAESTGKRGTGIVPVADEPLAAPEAYGDDRVFVHLHDAAAPDEEAQARLAELAERDHPVLTLPYEEPVDVGALFFTWEMAIAVAGAVLQINPFDQPDVQEAKDLTKRLIDSYVDEGGFPPEQPDAVEGALEAYGGRGSSVTEALADLLGQAEPGRYFATLAYVPESPDADAALRDLRVAVRDRRRCATTVGYGPRYLHSTGQLHKGGPPTGVFLQVTCEGGRSVEVPGRHYDFEALVRAQAAGDLQALRARERPTLRVHLRSDPESGLRELAEAVGRALA